MTNIYHVSKQGNDTNNGSITAPFLTIQKAASLALPVIGSLSMKGSTGNGLSLNLEAIVCLLLFMKRLKMNMLS